MSETRVQQSTRHLGALQYSQRGKVCLQSVGHLCFAGMISSCLTHRGVQNDRNRTQEINGPNAVNRNVGIPI